MGAWINKIVKFMCYGIMCKGKVSIFVEMK
jgi:hypothetical protein